MPGTTGSHFAGELDACCSSTVRGAQARAGRRRRASYLGRVCKGLRHALGISPLALLASTIRGRSALTAQRDEPLLGRRRDSLNAASMTCCPDPTAPAPTPRRPTAAPRGLKARPLGPGQQCTGPGRRPEVTKRDRGATAPAIAPEAGRRRPRKMKARVEPP
ncbi:hypothetical protein NDU88_006366 [Pleurodeles waltl]|uniref:Uncharacterized protein n=1 Tax=Pleurodeles waltl TaxID=8319 RepID=A0AAV7NQJ1_PLEWA|nr:hypothetical protein NDU88_006366 [Pleurodeles waltl]